MKIQDSLRHISSFQIIILGFLLVILTGSLLLMLPISTQDGTGAGFLDAFFTSVYFLILFQLSITTVLLYHIFSSLFMDK